MSENLDCQDGSSQHSLFTKQFNTTIPIEIAHQIEVYAPNLEGIDSTCNQNHRVGFENQHDWEEIDSSEPYSPESISKELENSKNQIYCPDQIINQNQLPSNEFIQSDHESTSNPTISQSINDINKNLAELQEKIIIIRPTIDRRISKSALICEYLFKGRRDTIGIRFTRAHTRMLKNFFNGFSCTNTNLLHYAVKVGNYYQIFKDFANNNNKVLTIKCKISEKLTSNLFNSAFWKDYFSTDIVIESFHYFIDCIFSEGNKEVLRNRINKKIEDFESYELWELRKNYLKDLLFIVS